MTITKVKHARALTGGGAALDSYSVATLNLGTYIYKAMVFSGGKFYYYEYDPAGTAAENSPLIIRPDDYATTGSGNWILGSSPYGDLQVIPEIVSGMDLEGDITGGNSYSPASSGLAANTIGYTPISCLDRWRATKIFTTTVKTVLIPTVANTLYYIFAVKLVADGSCEFRAYSTSGAVTSDAQVSAYRFVDYWRTNAVGSVVEGRMVSGTHWNEIASQNLINTASQPPANCSTAVSLAGKAPAEIVFEVLLGGRGTANSNICVGWDGAYVHDLIITSATYTGDTDIFAWGAQQANWMPVISDNIYWGDGSDATANTASLLLHAVKLRR